MRMDLATRMEVDWDVDLDSWAGGRGYERREGSEPIPLSDASIARPSPRSPTLPTHHTQPPVLSKRPGASLHATDSRDAIPRGPPFPRPCHIPSPRGRPPQTTTITRPTSVRHTRSIFPPHRGHRRSPYL